ncbi:MAG: hypothetical protein ABIC91_06775 [Nanoarchaeota archaeon]|nr:hypothetical protein [Nanoarchaeota archaeon]MBU1030227.1 hypothetical protein [Nanoarchaeota archaeon]MBU1849907.1 hypothetical protein [Nanoarchaeota archaeon]
MINKEERIKRLQELKKKKEEELKVIEENKKKEIKEAEEILKANIEDLAIEEEKEIIEERKQKKATGKNERSLQEEIESLEEEIKKEEIISSQKEKPYGAPIEELQQRVENIYQASNYNVYNELKTTLEKVERGGYLTRQEQEQLERQKEKIMGFEVNQSIVEEKDSFGYIGRSQQIIKQISKNMHQADYNP